MAGIEGSVIPGNSPSFHILLFTGSDEIVRDDDEEEKEEEEENAERIVVGFGREDLG